MSVREDAGSSEVIRPVDQRDDDDGQTGPRRMSVREDAGSRELTSRGHRLVSNERAHKRVLGRMKLTTLDVHSRHERA